MRRFGTIPVALAALALVVSGCAGSSSNNTASVSCDTATGSGPKIGVAYDVGGRGDQSFNDMAWAGVEKAISDLGATCLEAKAGVGEDDTTRQERLQTLADAGYNPIIAVGFIYSPAAAAAAAANPNTDFAVIDGYSQFITPAPNLVDLTFAENEGSYLVGVAAALKTQAKHVGFVGGTHGDLIKKFEAGFTAGVQSVDPSIQIDVKYLTEDPNDGATGFENPAGGKTAAEGMYDNGADIVYHAAGKSGLGVFQAAVAAGPGHWAIGVDSDQYLTADDATKPFILTSMIKRVDVAVFDTVKAFQDGAWVDGNVTYDLKAEGVGYSTSGGFIDDIKPQIEDAKQKIISGEITVPAVPAS